VVIATHNLNLAARYADIMVLMDSGRVVVAGTPADVVTPSTIEAAYDWPVEIAIHPSGAPQVSPRGSDRRELLDLERR
jgi:ABC-type hemin transport system ATPase subunit